MPEADHFAALTAAIITEPDDDLPRLVYADALDERGAPGDMARAEFIRLQCQLATMDATSSTETLPLRQREAILLNQHLATWLAPLKRRGQPFFTPRSHAQFRRGFVEIAWMPAGWFRDKAEKLMSQCPVRELRLTHATQANIFLLCNIPELEKLHTLDLSDRRLGDDAIGWLTSSPCLCRLKRLRVRACDLSDDAVDSLLDPANGWQLDELDVTHNRIGPIGLQRLKDRFGTGLMWEAN